MFGRKNKRKLSVSLEEPKFSIADRQNIRGFKNCSTWNTIFKYAHWKLIDIWMCTNKVSDDFKAGYFACMEMLDNLPVEEVEETEDDKPSMFMDGFE